MLDRAKELFIKDLEKNQEKVDAFYNKALDSLKFVKWEYSNSKKVPLTEEQILSIDYKKFEKFYIKFDIIEI